MSSAYMAGGQSVNLRVAAIPSARGNVKEHAKAASRAFLSAIRGTRSSACNSIQTSLGLLLNFLPPFELLLALYRLGSFLVIVCVIILRVM